MSTANALDTVDAVDAVDTTEESRRLAVAALMAADTEVEENRTVEEVEAAVTAKPKADNAVKITDAQMHNTPQSYEILPEKTGIQGLRIYLKAIASSRTPELVQAIFQSFPNPIYVASKCDLTKEGNFDLEAIAQVFTEIEQPFIQGSLMEVNENLIEMKKNGDADDQELLTDDEIKAAVESHIVTPRTVLQRLMALEEGLPGEPTTMDLAIPEIAQTVWMLAGNCPQNKRDWTVEKLEEAMRKGFGLTDYARLARLLLEVNSIGGGFASDLVERFTQLS